MVAIVVTGGGRGVVVGGGRRGGRSGRLLCIFRHEIRQSLKQDRRSTL